VRETNLESTDDYEKRLQEQDERISSLALEVSVVTSVADDCQTTVNTSEARQEKIDSASTIGQ
jgi:hypothetical protein